jgi:hypothetical protein
MIDSIFPNDDSVALLGTIRTCPSHSAVHNRLSALDVHVHPNKAAAGHALLFIM